MVVLEKGSWWFLWRARQTRTLACLPSPRLALLASLPFGIGVAPAAAGALRQVQTNGGMIDLQVTVNKAETLSADQDFSEVLVGNPEIADVVALTSTSLYVLGKKIGTTGISLLSSDKRVMAVINVEVTYDIKGLKARIAEHAHGSNVDVSSVNGQILLTGTVRDTSRSRGCWRSPSRSRPRPSPTP